MNPMVKARNHESNFQLWFMEYFMISSPWTNSSKNMKWRKNAAMKRQSIISVSPGKPISSGASGDKVGLSVSL